MSNFFRKLRTYLSINFFTNFKNIREDQYLYKKINYFYNVLHKKQRNSKKKNSLNFNK